MNDDAINELEERFADIIENIKCNKMYSDGLLEDKIDELSCNLEKDIFNTYREYDSTRVVDKFTKIYQMADTMLK